MRVITLLLFVMGVFSVWTTLGQTPAFNPSVRAETLMGGWRIPATDAMYDPGAYAFQRGYAFLMADMSISADTETRDEIASANVAEMRARQAISALNTPCPLIPRMPMPGLSWLGLRRALQKTKRRCMHCEYHGALRPIIGCLLTLG